MILVSQYGDFHGEAAARLARSIYKGSVFCHTSLTNYQLIADMNRMTALIALQKLMMKAGIKKTLVTKEKFDQYVSSKIKSDTKVVHLFSNASEHTIKIAKNKGCKVIIDWGIAEPRELGRVMRKASDNANVPYIDDTDIDLNLRILKASDKILVPSDYVYTTFQNTEFADKLIKIPYGCPPPLHKQNRESRTDKKIKICFAGNFSLRKSAPCILKVIKKIKNKFNVEFDVIGGIDEDIKLRFHEDLKLIDRVYGVRRAAIVTHMMKYDLMVFPSLCEGMARVVSEAMSAALPCIITAETGFTNILHDRYSALYVEKNNPEQLYDCLEQVIANGEKLSSLSRNCQHASTIWTWQKYQESLKEVYEELIWSN